MSTEVTFRRSSAAMAGLLLVLLGWLASPAQAQSSELFFSEYIEGSSNNKALEIFNGTGAAVDLTAGGYSVKMFFNGSATAGLTINLVGTVAPGDVFVLAQANASSAILGVADQTNGAGWFNGDDAVVLLKGTTVIDAIGQVGIDPGTQWGDGVTSTADNTLRRQTAVTSGDTNSGDAFDPAVEWIGFDTDTFDGLGSDGEVPPAVPAEIWEIQGAGLTSPLVGKRTRTSGVVTAVFDDGFFIQAVGAGDGNAETSDGLFVFTGNAPNVKVGDEAEVTGSVAEFFNLTEINGAEVLVTRAGVAVPAPVVLDASRPAPTQPKPANEMERLEGMLVRAVEGTVSEPTNRFGEIALVAGHPRPFREPGILFPGLANLPVWDGNPEIFEIDTTRFLNGDGLPIAVGAKVTAEGPLSFAFGDYQIWPTSLTVTGAEAVNVSVRAPNAGEFTVGSQNVLRLFDLEDDPDLDDEQPTGAAYERQLGKLSLQIRQVLGSPDVLAVQEVENIAALTALAERISSDDPAVVYTPYLFEGNDIGGIDVGFLVRSTVRVDSIEQLGKDDPFTPPSGSTTTLNDRPPLLLRGAYLGNGAPFPFAVMNVHQRSLSGVDGTDGARVRQKRHEQAQRLASFIESLQTATPGLRLVVIGDFNAFEFTDGYVDVMGQVTGRPDPAGALVPATDTITMDLTNQTLKMPAHERYSFVFDGTAQSLDHALTSRPLDRFVRGTAHSRGNADAPSVFGLIATTPLRSADHDGTVVFVMSDADGDGVPDDQDACAGTVVPEQVPLARLAENRYALVDGDRTFDTPVRRIDRAVFTLDDTRGCSCGQILDVVQPHSVADRLIGCSVATMNNWITPQP